MLRVAIVDRFHSSNWYSWHLAKELSELLRGKGLLFLYGPKNMRCNYINSYVCRPLWLPGFFPLQIIRQSLKDKVKLIHLQFEFVTFGSFYTSLFVVPFLLLLKLFHLKSIVTLHGPIFQRDASKEIISILKPANIKAPLTMIKFYITTTYIMMSKLSSAVIVHGHCFKKWLTEYGVKNCYVIPHGITEERKEIYISPNNGIRANNRNTYILFFGVLSPRKGLENLLQAFAEVLKDKDKNNITLVIAGDEPPHYRGYKRKLINMTYNLGIKNNVIFTGYVSDDQIDVLFRQAEIVVLSYPYSISASGPLSLAIQYRKPIIATATEFFTEELRNGKAALLVPRGKPECLAKAIKQLIADENLRKRLIENTTLIIKERSWKKVAQKTLKLYQKICNNE
jgi:glycosyltransferase involved in cell wall biosynthesis